MSEIRSMQEWLQSGGKIAIFCAGQNGYTFYRILQLLGITVDCVVDNNSAKWECKVFDDVICKNPEFLCDKKEYLTYICIGPQYYSEICTQAKAFGIAHIADVKFVVADIICNYTDIYFRLLSELPYGNSSEFFYDSSLIDADKQELGAVLPENEKIAVYTSVFGSYDTIRKPQYQAENIDYYFVSDQKPDSLEGYQWLDAKKFLPKGMDDAVTRNRYVKMHPHILFSEYKYSIYIDGNVEVLNDISSFVQKSKTGISVFLHPLRDDVFMEALAVVNHKRENGEIVCQQMKTYMEEKMPFKFGLPEMRVIAREHHNPYCIKIMEDWWHEFVTRSKRDQLSFMYVIWKNGLLLSDMFILGKNMRQYDSMKIYSHVRKET